MLLLLLRVRRSECRVGPRVLLNLHLRVQHLLGLLREVRRLHLALDGHLAEGHADQLALTGRGALAVGCLLLQLLIGGLVHVDHVFGVFTCTMLMLLLLQVGLVRGAFPRWLVHV